MGNDAPDVLSAEFAEDPYAAYAVLREEFPLLWHEGMQSWIVSRYEDVERVFKDPVFTTANYDWQLEPVHGKTILQLSGREHAVRRALVTPAFRGSELEEKFLPVIERNADELIDAFKGRGSVELISEFASRFPIGVMVDMLGLEKKDHERFQGWYTTIIAFLGNLAQDPEITAAGLRTKEEFAEYMIPIVHERRSALGTDLLSTLVSAEVDGAVMSDEDVKAFCSLLLAAGGETTDKAIGSLFSLLLRHPEQFAAVSADRSLIPNAFAETLRYAPPVHMIMRQPSADVEIAGGTIPAGATVTALIGAANRDPRRFSRPEEFDIRRDDLNARNAFSAAANHLAFALGAHFCVGALLAKTEIEVGVNRLLDALPEARLADGFVPREKGVFTRGQESLPIEFTPAAS